MKHYLLMSLSKQQLLDIAGKIDLNITKRKKTRVGLIIELRKQPYRLLVKTLKEIK